MEGNAADPEFTPDGKKLCYRIVNRSPSFFQFNKMKGEVWVADLESGRSAPLASGLKALAYDISSDGRHVVLEVEDDKEKPRLWLTSFERELPPQQIPNVEGRQPKFGLSGEIFFHGNGGFVYRVLPDGATMQKALERRVLILLAISPDGKYLQSSSGAGLGGSGRRVVTFYPLF